MSFAAALLGWLLEPFQLEVQRRALVEVILAGGAGGVLGCHVVLRRLGFMSDALSHAVLPGVVFAFLAAGAAYILYGALAAGLIGAVAIALIARERRLQQDAAVGIVLTGGFALGVVLISTLRSYAAVLEDFLFGNVLLVSSEDLALTAALAAAVLGVLLVFHRRFVLRAFDPDTADAMGLHGLALDLLLLVLLAATVVVSLRAIGNILAVAFLITPAATARLLTKRVPAMMATAGVIGAGTGAAGLEAAYHLDLAAGALIVCLATVAFGAVLLLRPRRGALVLALRRERSPGAAAGRATTHGH